MKNKIIIYIFGINILAFGIVLNTKCNLGVSAFTSFYYALSKIEHISLGTASIILYLILVILEAILMKKFTLQIILQIPFSFVFGFITDIYNNLIVISIPNLFVAVIVLIIAIACVSLGAYLTVNSNMIVNPVDGSVKTLATVTNKPFSFVKNYFDITMVIITVCFCLALKQPIYGIGIGTIISAVLNGRFVYIYETLLQNKLFKSNEVVAD
ncbi:MAG: DUF6198 family protein [Thomasclavelia sp.]|nr:DUF6198 family protein [Thomasclavelia sp.]